MTIKRESSKHAQGRKVSMRALMRSFRVPQRDLGKHLGEGGGLES